MRPFFKRKHQPFEITFVMREKHCILVNPRENVELKLYLKPEISNRN